MQTRVVAGEICIVPNHQDVAKFDAAYTLNKVGAFLWENLDGSRDADGLAALLRERFAVPAERDVRADVDAFLGELARRGLLRDAAAGGAGG